MIAGQHLYFIGVGGMGMTPLALYLLQHGVRVGGMDDAMPPRLRRLLLDWGCEIQEPGETLPGEVDRVVYSSGVPADHPRLLEARERGLPIVRRGEILAELAREKRFLAVVGSHGKTTTTGMLVHAARRAGFDCDYILGGLFADPDELPARCGGASWLIAEVDESDGTIASFSPTATLVVNLDWDHADRYATEESLVAEFEGLLGRTRESILVPYELRTLLDNRDDAQTARVATFGAQGDYRAEEVAGRPGDGLRISLDGAFPARELSVGAAGAFNAHNATAALAAVHLLCGRIPEDALSGFPGIHRRQTCLFAGENLRVFGDYAHHPTEIAALLKHWRDWLPDWRLQVVFQPHRYSRTRRFRDEFVNSLSRADDLYLLETYGAGEKPQAGGRASDLRDAFPGAEQPAILNTRADLDRVRAPGTKPCLLGFVGAGDIESWAEEFVGSLRVRHATRGSWLERAQQTLSPQSVLRCDEAIGPKTTLRVGGMARYYSEPSNLADLQRLLHLACSEGISVFFLGRGSNVIVPDDGFDGLVVRLTGEAWKGIAACEDGSLRVGAGVRTKELCAFACREGFGGFEFLEGIPGTVGGALRMNAGAMHCSMFDVVRAVQAVGYDGVYREIDHDACRATYRSCPGLRDAVAVGASLEPASRESTDRIRETIRDFSERRKRTQPREPSAGCMFKNPDGAFAGRLIDELGLKGTSVGGAKVSEVHGNFVVNRGDATARDVLELIRRIRDTARRERGIVLEPEVLLLGRSWEEVLE